MRIARHQYVFVFLALGNKCREEIVGKFYDTLQFRADKQFQVYQYLVVAAASAVYFFPDVAETACQHQFDLGVDIFDAVFDEKITFFGYGVDVP